MNRFADIIDQHQKLLAVLILFITLLAFTGIIRLEYALDPQINFDKSGSDYELLQRLNEEFGSNSLDCVLLVRGADVFTREFITSFRELIRQIKEIEGVDRIISLDNVPIFSGLIPERLLPADLTDNAQMEQARQKALAHPMIAGHLLSSPRRHWCWSN